MITLNNVVLPAPFGPMTLTISPSSTVKVEVAQGGQPAELLLQTPDLEQVSR